MRENQDRQYQKIARAWAKFNEEPGELIQKQQDAYDDRGKEYSSNNMASTVVKNHDAINGIVENYSTGEGKLLDIGCADGYRTDHLNVGNMVKYGLDLSEEMIKLTRERGIEGCVASATDIPFKEEYFDLLTCLNGTLGCLPSEEGRFNALKEFYRTLKKGGKLILDVFNQEGYFGVHVQKNFEASKKFDGNFKFGDTVYSVNREAPCYVRHFSDSEIVGAVEDVGFKVVDKLTVGYGEYKGKDYGGKINDGFNEGSLVYILSKK